MNIIKATYEKPVERISTKIRNKTRVFTFYILRQYNTWDLMQNFKTRNEDRVDVFQKWRCPSTAIWRWYDFLCKRCKTFHQKTC